VAVGTSTSFSSIVSRFPRRIVQKRTQSKEMVHVQMSLLPTQRTDFRCLIVCVPDLVALPGLLRGLSVPQVVFPDGKPLFQERAITEVDYRRA
jgi:hypothetical protein